MLRLFHSIFGGDDEPERYPETLVREAIERAVDGTDPWLRGLSGYRRKLRPAVLHALDHVMTLVDGMSDPLELSRANYGDDPRLRFFFVSHEQLESVVHGDPALAAWRREPGHAGRPAWAVLLMACEQHRTFGVDLLGETLVRDVAQTTVGMAGHRLVDPAGSLAACRRQLKRRAFDHLLALALARIAAVEDVREELLQRRTLLQAKHDMLEGSGWGFGSPAVEAPPALDDVHRQLAELERQLLEVGGDTDYLAKHLEILLEVLSGAEHQLWIEPLRIIVDRMGIKRTTVADDAPELMLAELHNAAGQRLIAQPVTVPATASA